MAFLKRNISILRKNIENGTSISRFDLRDALLAIFKFDRSPIMTQVVNFSEEEAVQITVWALDFLNGEKREIPRVLAVITGKELPE